MKFFIPFIVIGICIGMYFVYINPTITEVQTLSTNKTEYNNILEKIKELSEKRDAILIEYNSIPESDKARLNKIIPETFNPSLFANDINSMASQNGLSIREFKVNEPKTEVREAIINQPQPTGYKTTVIAIKLNGQYSQFVKFLSNLESDLHLIDVLSLLIKPVGSGKSSDTSLEYLLEVRTYSLR